MELDLDDDPYRNGLVVFLGWRETPLFHGFDCSPVDLFIDTPNHMRIARHSLRCDYQSDGDRASDLHTAQGRRVLRVDLFHHARRGDAGPEIVDLLTWVVRFLRLSRARYRYDSGEDKSEAPYLSTSRTHA